jgi:adenylate cyclase
MLSKLRQRWNRFLPIPIAATVATGLALALTSTGIFQYLELKTLDLFFRSRPLESIDRRIVVVTIGEEDLEKLGHWPINDASLAQVLTKIDRQQPRVIGIDLYRNIPVLPGNQELQQVYRSIDKVIVVEKVIGDRIAAPILLEQKNRVAFADLVVDPDGKVRRGLLSLVFKGRMKLSLGTKAALDYLEQEGINLEVKDDKQGEYQLGKALFHPIHRFSGGYTNIDSGGYQVFLNYRGGIDRFQTISISDILSDRIPEGLFQDKIVFLGSAGESLKDNFFTPYGEDREPTPGVIIHANTTSLMISAALDGRTLLGSWSEIGEWFWVFGWSGVGALVGVLFFQGNIARKVNLFYRVSFVFFSVATIGGVFLAGYAIFCIGYWLPVTSPVFSSLGSILAVYLLHNRELKQLAFVDGLTKIANRRFLDRYLEQVWQRNLRSNYLVSVILCDVDYFKLYNDYYGHQAGDKCLQEVAKAISITLRKNDLVARYGGEEFIIVLPKTDAQTAMRIAQRMLDRVKVKNLSHSRSQVSDRVTLSCGIATVTISPDISPTDTIAIADKALYQAKHQGRSRAVLAEIDGRNS